MREIRNCRGLGGVVPGYAPEAPYRHAGDGLVDGSAKHESHDPLLQELKQPRRGQRPSITMDESKPHRFWLAKKAVAFFSISLSSVTIRNSRRNRSFSRAKA